MIRLVFPFEEYVEWVSEVCESDDMMFCNPVFECASHGPLAVESESTYLEESSMTQAPDPLLKGAEPVILLVT